jgi:SAM-dependent methyltransferase
LIDPSQFSLEIEEAARVHKVEASIHAEDFIFQFVISHPGFEKKSHAIRYYFDDGARSCDRFCTLVSRFLPQREKQMRVLEFASGYGCVTRHLKRRTMYDVTACDIHPAAMTYIAEKNRTRNAAIKP